MREPHERLRWARQQAGFESGSDAARALGVTEATYLGHENGSRGFRLRAERYARRFGVSLEWLLTGRGARLAEGADRQRTVPLVGYVGAGSGDLIQGLGQGPFEEVQAPDGSTENTRAVEIRGESLGSIFDRWLVFYDDVRRPVTSDLVGRLCIVGLPDERVLIKQIRKSRARGRFHLYSNTGEPILDAEVEWAARVKNMVPR